MHTLERHDLEQKLKTRDDIVLVEVLAQDEYDQYHLPYSINVPLSDQFESDIVSRVADNDTPIVVYCKNSRCNASSKAAHRIEVLGYSRVYDYEGGKEDWKSAGLPIAARDGVQH